MNRLIFLLVLPLSAQNYGHVTVGKPKVWSFDRVHATLDGLLRDLNSVKVAKLDDLNPNSTNQVLLDMLQTSLNAGVKFNGGTALSNRLLQQKIEAIRPAELERVNLFNENVRLVQARRAEVFAELTTVLRERSALDPQAANYTDQKAAADRKIEGLRTQLSELDKLSLSAPSVTDLGTPAATGGEKPTPLTPILTAADVKALFGGEANKASLPATRKLDNIITLLHERLSRELSASFDDVSRNRDMYLVQFDIGAYPTKYAKDHVLRVVFDVDPDNSAHDLYPGVSAYNLAQFNGRSRGTGLAAAASFLAGFGLTAEYKRQRETARSSITQGVYVAGFGAGTPQFGWYFGPSPEEHTLVPGVRTAYAVLVVPKGTANVVFRPSFSWEPRTKPGEIKEASNGRRLTPVNIPLAVPPLCLTRLAYQTRYQPSITNDNTEAYSTVELSFRDIIDPNLVISVNGSLLPRLRDFRGRAISESQSQASGPATFGILETDASSAGHWYAVGPTRLVLRIARSVAGTNDFPTIRFSQSGDNTRDLFSLANDQCFCEARINQHDLKGQLPRNTLVPLFAAVQERPLVAWYTRSNPNSIHVALATDDPNLAPLDGFTQVLLENGDQLTALACVENGQLTCKLPPGKGFTPGSQLIVERGSKGQFPGIVGRVQPIPRDSSPMSVQGPWVVHEVLGGSHPGWMARILVRNLPAHPVVHDFGDVLSGEAKPAPVPAVYSVNDPFDGKPVGLEFWIPRDYLGHLQGVRLHLHDQGVTHTGVYLPDLFSQLVPRVLSHAAASHGYVLRGKNFSAIKTLNVVGCRGPETPRKKKGQQEPAQCEWFRTSNLITINVPAGVPSGTYPIEFGFDNDLQLAALDATGAAIALSVTRPAESDAAQAPAPPPPASAAPPPAPAQETLKLLRMELPPEATPDTLKQQEKQQERTAKTGN